MTIKEENEMNPFLAGADLGAVPAPAVEGTRTVTVTAREAVLAVTGSVQRVAPFNRKYCSNVQCSLLLSGDEILLSFFFPLCLCLFISKFYEITWLGKTTTFLYYIGPTIGLRTMASSEGGRGDTHSLVLF